VPEKLASTLVGHIEPSDHPSITDAEIAADRQERCAATVVNLLLERTGLSRTLEPQSLNVIVGKGNWISFSFQMQRGADHSSLDVSKDLRRTKGKAQQGKSYKSVWFRSKGLPSLHFEVIPAERLGDIFVRGHVDAADPTGHPFAHLLRDYLPAHGVGSHPTPEALLAMVLPNSRA
jgi:hypothetical protein